VRLAVHVFVDALGEEVGLDVALVCADPFLIRPSRVSKTLIISKAQLRVRGRREDVHTQSISSRSSDSNTIEVTMPRPGAAFIVTSTFPKKMYFLLLMRGAWLSLVMVKIAPLPSMLRGESLPITPSSGFQRSLNPLSLRQPSPAATEAKSTVCSWRHFPKAGSGAHSTRKKRFWLALSLRWRLQVVGIQAAKASIGRGWEVLRAEGFVPKKQA